MFEIYSLGDGLFMKRVLDGVAMMSSSGFLLALGGFGMLVGLLLTGLKAIETGGQKVELPNLFVSFLLILGMFSIKVDTTLYALDGAPGANTLQTYTVDNVPFGVAAPAMVVSTIGKVITEKMQQAFAVPGMEEFDVNSGMFGNTLKLLDMTRRWDLDGLKGTQSKVSTFKTNLRSYYAECTIPAIQRGAIDQNAVMSAANPLSFHETDGGIGFRDKWTSVNYITSTGPAVLDCDVAMERLIVDSNDAGMESSFLNSAMAMTDARSNSTDPTAAANSAFAAIGAGTSSIHNHVMASAIREIMDEAVAGSSTLTPQDIQAQLMLIQGNRQRQDEWGAGEIMFRKAMRPFMAFLECIVFIAAPFMALIAGMGTFGQRVVGKYFAVILWVTTWAPMFAAVDLFQLTMVQHAVTAMERLHAANHGVPLSSIAGAAALNSELTTWIAVGGWMATLVPPMGYLLLSGGAVAMTSFAGRLSGGDHVNEKMTSPDLAKMGEVMNVSSRMAHSGGAGTSMTGVDNLGGSFNMGGSASASVESARSAMETASRTASTTLNSAINSSLTSTQGVTTSSGVTSQVSDSIGDGTSFTRGQSVGSDVSDQSSRDKKTSDATNLDKNIGLSANGAGSASGESASRSGGNGGAQGQGKRGGQATGIVSGGISSSNRQSSSEDSSFGNTSRLSDSERAGLDRVMKAETAAQKVDMLGRMAQEGSSAAQGILDSYSKSQAAQDLKSASENYSEADRMSQTVSNLTGTSVQDWSWQVSQRGSGAVGEAVAAAVDTGGAAAFQKNLSQVQDWRGAGLFAGDDNQARAMAAGMTLAGNGAGYYSTNSGSEGDRFSALAELTNKYSVGAAGASVGNASANAGLQDSAPAYGQATEATSGLSMSNVPDAGAIRSAVSGDIASGSGVDAGRVNTGAGGAANLGNRGERDDFFNNNYGAARQDVQEGGRAALRENLNQGVNTPDLTYARSIGDFWGAEGSNPSGLAIFNGYMANGTDGTIPQATGASGPVLQRDDDRAMVGDSGLTRYEELRREIYAENGFSKNVADQDTVNVIAAARLLNESRSEFSNAYLTGSDADRVEASMQNLSQHQKNAMFGGNPTTNDMMNVAGGGGFTGSGIGSAMVRESAAERPLPKPIAE
ncbi:conjugal transfer protein TraG N-terminal domain-containing protein [Xanthomonas hortorum pv. vitians]|uniref:conjugal transfer protein TraG N-terminal domain-containing protein n=1 Tax=Xanthomonas hortorum TaxID=56454 RepID=UPI0025A25607|nr:conjugal transfer protein TraG N-terminal domain-containing protein [Xanthomonas hortorum]WJM76700.1 conjugal transfer protein TraG N-terminal domain-containing protein [Xanthomonas hortorum pv. vitians]